jgi:hypothetical protein
VSLPLTSARYSGTPLPRKLGLKEGQAVAFIALPETLSGLAECELFADVDRVSAADELGPSEPHDLIHAFYTRAHDLELALNCLRAAIKPAGMIWISWPKKAAKVETDITEDVVRGFALARGLVDVKVCAVDEVWSGLKLVIPVAQRLTQPKPIR